MDIVKMSSVNVLVVEDDTFVQKVISRLLDKIGVASVVVTGSGEEALKHLAHADPEEPPIDIVICDIEMPGMNGFEFTRSVRYGTLPQYKDVSILMLTAVDSDENVRRGKIHKIDAFLIKPPTEDMLRNNMVRALGSSPVW